MRRRYAPLMLALLAAALLRCGGTPTEVVDGGGGSEAVGLTGIAMLPGGAPAGGAQVRLRSRFFLAEASALASLASGADLAGNLPDAVADSAGAFRLDSVPRGEYFLEITAADPAVSGDSLSTLVPVVLTGESPLVGLPPTVLKPTGTVAGSFLPPAGFIGRTLVQVYGLDRWVRADSITGAFRLHGMPAGTFRLRASYTVPAVDPREVDGVEANPGDTTDIGALQLGSFENENYGGWPHARRIVLNTTASGAGVEGNVDGFPLLVRLHAGNFDFSQSRGTDLRFSDARGQRLRYEIERWDSAAASAEIWVRLSRVNGNTSDQFITMHWGLPGAQDWSDGRRVFGTDIDFAAVWHLDEEAADTVTADLYRDAVGFDPADDRAAATDRAGLIGRGHGFAAGDYLAVPVASSLLKPAFRVTVSAWVKVLSTGSVGANVLSMGDNYNLRVTDQGRGRFTLYDGDIRIVETQDPMLLDSAWHLLAATYDGEVLQIYVDGKLITAKKATGGIQYNFSPSFIIGKHGNRKSGYDFIGNLDEVQVSGGVSRSPDWLKLSYENQRADSRLLEFAPQTRGGTNP